MIFDYKNASMYVDLALQTEPQSVNNHKSIKGIILSRGWNRDKI